MADRGLRGGEIALEKTSFRVTTGGGEDQRMRRKGGGRGEKRQ